MQSARTGWSADGHLPLPACASGTAVSRLFACPSARFPAGGRTKESAGGATGGTYLAQVCGIEMKGGGFVANTADILAAAGRDVDLTP
ncbi:hypothetical protein ACFWBV_13140 [Streptomyces sp. NPDC060030]|uniref:hypothetical protein n=1 Tax=Streptomyces sp. NPDC060030 TaxID=3347042 RepID=UPI00368B31D3